MLIKKEDSHKHVNSPACTVWEYEYPSKNSGVATSFINGRYPEKGFVVNLECDEIFYVISGAGKVETEKGHDNISEGDVVFLEKGKKYATNGKNMKIVIINAPKWKLEQHKHFEN